MDACNTRPSGVQVVALIGPIPNPQLNWGLVTFEFRGTNYIRNLFRFCVITKELMLIMRIGNIIMGAYEE